MKYKTEEDKRQVARSFFLKSIEDKRAINKCIREGGNLNKVIDERKVKFSAPIIDCSNLIVKKSLLSTIKKRIIF